MSRTPARSRLGVAVEPGPDEVGERREIEDRVVLAVADGPEIGGETGRAGRA